ncbi:MAG: YmdB family metallophosphoesterase [Cyanobacteria bacterium HKST-UBA05]|nr:YmdB family metallophosphoesterase [Cyanobacteria bacterium HKST-UBA05]
MSPPRKSNQPDQPDQSGLLDPAAEPLVDILFLGDIVGRSGRRGVAHYLAHHRAERRAAHGSARPELVIANVENASHGFGLTEKGYHELCKAGVDVMTGGNHIWDRKEIVDWIDQKPNIVRPANFAEGSPGRGWLLVPVDLGGGRTVQVGVINLIGQVFMGQYNSPWEAMVDAIEAVRAETDLVFVDFHAEATAEKMAMGHYACRLGASAFTGTHTHVQTADQQVLMERMGYITDSGFCGPFNSVIGFVPDTSINRMKGTTPTRIEVSEEPLVQINGCRFTLAVNDGRCVGIERVQARLDISLPDDEITVESLADSPKTLCPVAV